MNTSVRRNRYGEGGIAMGPWVEELLVCKEVSCGCRFLKCLFYSSVCLFLKKT